MRKLLVVIALAALAGCATDTLINPGGTAGGPFCDACPSNSNGICCVVCAILKCASTRTSTYICNSIV